MLLSLLFRFRSKVVAAVLGKFLCYYVVLFRRGIFNGRFEIFQVEEDKL